jgi:hypothetical protein
MKKFSWGIHPDAEKELNECEVVYGLRFRQELKQWLAAVAVGAAEGREFDGGIDPNLPEVLHFVTSERLRTWLFAAQLFRRKAFLEQLKALIQTARTRKPPYEYWATEKYFPDVASSFEHTVKAFFIVDQVHRRITFLAFADLPGS